MILNPLVAAVPFVCAALPAAAATTARPVLYGGALLAILAALLLAFFIGRRSTGERTVAVDSALTAFEKCGYLILADDAGARGGVLPATLGAAKGSHARLDDLLADIAPAERTPVQQAVDALRRDGAVFDMVVAAGPDEAVRLGISGRRAQDRRNRAVDTLWLADVTADEAARAAAEAERHNLRAVIDAIPVPIWIRDRTAKLVDGNEAFRKAVEAQTLDEAVSDGLEIAASAIARSGKALAVEARDMSTALSQRHHIVIDGARRYLEITELPLPGTSTLMGYAIDKTDFDEARAELKRHMAAHGEVLEHLATAVAIYGADKRLKFFNSAFVNLWGLDGDFLYDEPKLGEVLEALRERRRLPEYADFPSWKREQERQFMTLIDPLEDLMHLPDGRALRTLTTPHPLGGLLFLYEDVTDRLALERSYNTLIAVQRETLDNLYEGVAVVGGDGRIRLFNPAFAHMWELPDDYLKGEPHVRDMIDHSRRFFDTEGWEATAERTVGRITDHQAHTGQIRRKDGVVLDYSFVPLPDGATLLSYRDSTDSHRVQESLREQAEALETTDRLKTEFLTNVSYALRTPLNTIIGFTEILNQRFYGELNDRQVEYVAGVLESSQNLLALIDNILDLAMIESGRMSLHPSRIDVGKMIDDVVEISDQWARQKGLSLDVERPDHLGYIEADERRLKQALINLISNAIAFTPEGGRIVVTGRREAGGVALAVGDSGIGIAPADQERIFRKFERGRGGSHELAGVGLGLALVKQLLELHGGSVELRSAPDLGTTVTCHVPESPVEAAAVAVSDPREVEA